MIAAIAGASQDTDERAVTAGRGSPLAVVSGDPDRMSPGLGGAGMMIASRVRSLLGLSRRPRPDPERETGRILFLHGKGDFLCEVSRASRHQAELHQVASRKAENWHRLECMAALLVDHGDPAERNAVAVEIDGWLVGFMPGHLATQYREWLHTWHWPAAGRVAALSSSRGRAASPAIRSSSTWSVRSR